MSERRRQIDQLVLGTTGRVCYMKKDLKRSPYVSESFPGNSTYDDTTLDVSQLKK